MTIAAVAFLGHAVIGQAAVTAPLVAIQLDVDATLRSFTELSPRKQIEVLDVVRDAVWELDDPYIGSLRSILDDCPSSGGTAAKMKLRRAKGRDGRRAAEDATRAWQGQLPFPASVAYVFGYEKIVPVDVFGTARVSARKAATEQRVAELRALLDGHVPGADQALAAMLAKLDTDRSADAFARLLETWRNGAESFYSALDRTAGTEDSVFFYDAMLADFVEQCVPSRHADGARVRASLEASHDALHGSFLAYRQYRGLREACALVLLLPPDVPLPDRLSRYDRASGDGYSVREILELLAADAGWDLALVLARIVEDAPELPDPIWSGSYEPLGPVFEVFDARMPAIIAAHGSTDAALGAAREQRRAIQTAVVGAAIGALRSAGVAVSLSDARD